MWRAFFSAIGIVLLVIGLECLVIERAVLANREDSIAQQARVQAASLFSVGSSQEPVTQIFRPSEWLPWGLLASGATICLYTMSKKD